MGDAHDYTYVIKKEPDIRRKLSVFGDVFFGRDQVAYTKLDQLRSFEIGLFMLYAI